MTKLCRAKGKVEKKKQNKQPSFILPAPNETAEAPPLFTLLFGWFTGCVTRVRDMLKINSLRGGGMVMSVHALQH